MKLCIIRCGGDGSIVVVHIRDLSSVVNIRMAGVKGVGEESGKGSMRYRHSKALTRSYRWSLITTFGRSIAGIMQVAGSLEEGKNEHNKEYYKEYYGNFVTDPISPRFLSSAG